MYGMTYCVCFGCVYNEGTHGEDGFTIKTVGENIALVGGVRGIIYAVHELLEQLGCTSAVAADAIRLMRTFP